MAIVEKVEMCGSERGEETFLVVFATRSNTFFFTSKNLPHFPSPLCQSRPPFVVVALSTLMPNSPSDQPPPSKKPRIQDMSTAAIPASTSQLLIKRLSPKATLPTRGSAFAAGLDLYSFAFHLPFPSLILSSDPLFGFRAEAKLIPARGKALVDTQLSMAIPLGTYGRIAPRSGLGRSITISKIWPSFIDPVSV